MGLLYDACRYPTYSGVSQAHVGKAIFVSRERLVSFKSELRITHRLAGNSRTCDINSEIFFLHRCLTFDHSVNGAKYGVSMYTN